MVHVCDRSNHITVRGGERDNVWWRPALERFEGANGVRFKSGELEEVTPNLFSPGKNEIFGSVVRTMVLRASLLFEVEKYAPCDWSFWLAKVRPRRSTAGALVKHALPGASCRFRKPETQLQSATTPTRRPVPAVCTIFTSDFHGPCRRAGGHCCVVHRLQVLVPVFGRLRSAH